MLLPVSPMTVLARLYRALRNTSKRCLTKYMFTMVFKWKNKIKTKTNNKKPQTKNQQQYLCIKSKWKDSPVPKRNWRTVSILFKWIFVAYYWFLNKIPELSYLWQLRENQPSLSQRSTRSKSPKFKLFSYDLTHLCWYTSSQNRSKALE